MHPSTVNTNSEMTNSSPTFKFGPTNLNLPSPNFTHSPTLNSNGTNSYQHFSYTDLISPTRNYMELLHTWNYHRFLSSKLNADQLSDDSSNDNDPRTSSFRHYNSRSLQKLPSHKTDDEIFLTKFRQDTLVNLDSGEPKNIQQLTTNDFLTSAKRSRQYSSLLARIDYISPVDKMTGKAELRFHIDDMEKTTSYYVLQEMPFFVHQHSCWSSISPEHTYHACGLKCRQLECGDIIIAITEQRRVSSTKSNGKPVYRHQSPTKSLVVRHTNEQISSSSSSNKRHKISKE
ncbi:unnamed protein product [Adineta steineri]|uniref:AXH domain-containing protein n=2 Tax=Adineta steineri TaxID=433720 RepID=A0A818KWJ6_9BILA|nr:unnamed protein product [Adineta steineri]